MSLSERILIAVEAVVTRLLLALWGRFLTLTVIGKGFAIVLSLFGVAWIAGELGLGSLAREFAEAGWSLLSFVLAAAVIRHIWLRFTRRARYPTW